MPPQHGHGGFNRILFLELEKVQHCVACFVNIKYCMAYGKHNRNDIHLKLVDTRKMSPKGMSMYDVYKPIDGLIKISMDHYQPCTVTATRSCHSQNLLPPYCRTDIYKHSFSSATINQ